MESSLSEKAARDLAERVVRGTIDPLAACIEVTRWRPHLEQVPEDLWDVFAGVASELDGLPIGEERQNWERRALEVRDAKADQYRASVGRTVTEAFRQLLLLLPEPESDFLESSMRAVLRATVSYDASADAAYIYLVDEMDAEGVARSYPCDPKEVGGQIVLDFDHSDRLVGIEVLDASKKLPKSLLSLFRAGPDPEK